MIGLFRQRYVLAGSLALADSPTLERPVLLTLIAARARLLPRLAGATEVEGVLQAPGFASDARVRGRIENDALRPFATRYELELENDQGQLCRLLASRRPNRRDLVWSASNVSGEIVDSEGRLLASVTLRLDYRRDIKRLLVG